jgi:hypothetical protein
MSVDSFKTGGTKGSDGKITYSAEEIAAAEKALKEAAEKLAVTDNNKLEALNEAIKALEISLEEAKKQESKPQPKTEDTTTSTEPSTTEPSTTEPSEDKKDEDDKKEENKKEEEKKYSKATENKDVLYSKVTSAIQEWIKDSARKEGDIKAIPYETTSTGADGKETKTLKGYYVVVFEGSNDNTYALKNVRHLLVSFEGGTKAEDGTTTYSDEEKAKAKAEAEELLAQFLAGEQTEEAFAALVAEKTDDTASAETGGLFENIHLGSNYVENFLNWANDDARTAGETGIVETEYGYHIMYFVGDSDMTYRDYQIENQLRNADLESWYTEAVAAMTQTEGDTSYIRKDVVLSAS